MGNQRRDLIVLIVSNSTYRLPVLLECMMYPESRVFFNLPSQPLKVPITRYQTSQGNHAKLVSSFFIDLSAQHSYIRGTLKNKWSKVCTENAITRIPADSPGFPGSLQVFREISRSPG